MIKVTNLKKDFVMGEVVVHALRGVSFEVARGEFVGIMGHSGSGKSTLLRQLGLIDEPTSGEIILDNHPTHELSEKERSRFRLTRLGYIFQEFALIPELTAIENVFLPAMMRGGNHEEYYQKAEEMLRIVGLADRLNHRPAELSGGQQQRVAVARSLINSPSVLFADEPTANLDSHASQTVMDTFKNLNQTLQQTIIIVTHEPEDSQYLDRVLWMKDGRLSLKKPKI
ncbi:MAG: ABC transporter [Candidatus Kerfeldbacteria bacterium RIFOXYA2_FULL_38_24]|uniref:ABC transporter n=1 Tax=Candidatus Kerfeldbacteria bacterium RIFOXYB2_FULL_38_14 TaxID=1798547 RepID=A0A1G2B9K2_9BACT|nr:MAG: ABC transporter [Candidatus Kerfeldbacteria bacterium RIFOXYA2_FULL_38_24]OGY85685.1 MAG: ABC transporter [Candidatus Kerfeldbacteria bacterium RIFOXYB2_FULL_38_14]OGY88371.1 MAG: ABC transporter [Candidatus Kerfeldbacteria bacterium RIFOXYC2_FULL_38_9]